MAEVGNLIWVGLMPHPPIVIPGVGGGREREAGATCDAMADLSNRLVAIKPEVLVVISPHSPRRPGKFGLWGGERLSGNLGRFGAPGDKIDLPVAADLMKEIAREADASGINTWTIQGEPLDHGAVVPLWYICDAGWNGLTVLISLNYPGDGHLEEFGESIARAIDNLDVRTAVLASGDMSHRLKPGAPGGFHPRAHEFDQAFVKMASAGDVGGLVEFPLSLQDIAGEDVLDSTRVAIAAAGGRINECEVLSYEGPFGVGYCVAELYSAVRSV